VRQVRVPLARETPTSESAQHPDATEKKRERADEDRADVVRGSRVTALVQLLNLAEPLLVILIVRSYGDAVWGQYVFAESLAYAGTRFASLGLDRGMLWIVSRSRAADATGGTYRAPGLSGALVTGVLTAIAVSIAGISLAPWVVGDLLDMHDGVTATQITLAALPFTVAMMIVVYTMLGTRSVGPDALVRTSFVPITARLIPIVLLPLALGSTAVAAGYLIANAAGLAIASVMLRRRLAALGVPREGFSWPTRTVFRYSIQAGLADLLATLLVRVDVWMIAWYLSDSEVGVYGVIISLVASLRSIRSLIDRPMVPIMGEATAARDLERVRTLFSHATFMVACITGPFLVLIWGAGRELLGIYGDRFEEGALAILVLSAGNLLVTVFGLATNVLSGAGRGGLLLFNSILMMVVNIGLNLIFIPLWGITGASLATSIALASVAALEYGMARTIMGGSLLKLTALEPLAAALFFVGCSLPVHFLVRDVHDFGSRLGAMAIFAVLYAIWFWRRGLQAFRARPVRDPRPR
jgi:O-antigen/teichoic acid export membrane protein